MFLLLATRRWGVQEIHGWGLLIRQLTDNMETNLKFCFQVYDNFAIIEHLVLEIKIGFGKLTMLLFFGTWKMEEEQ